MPPSQKPSRGLLDYVEPVVDWWQSLPSIGAQLHASAERNRRDIVRPLLEGRPQTWNAQAIAADPAMGWLGAGTVGTVNKGIRAFHGSPHDFDKFSLSKIGTGEGAQAYGHGLYFAENEGVAKSYRDALGGNNKQWLVDGAPVGRYGQNSSATGTAAAQLRQVMGSDGVVLPEHIAQAKERFSATHQRNPGMLPRKHIEETLAAMDGLAGRQVAEDAGGKMYEVNIKADPESLLDWDAPLSQQPEKVREAFADLRANIGDDEFNRMTGGGAYQTLGDATETSKMLLERGVPGLRYYDQGSRFTTNGEILGTSQTPNGWVARIRSQTRPPDPRLPNTAPEMGVTISKPYKTEAEAKAWAENKIKTGSRNIVAFDDNLVEILRKYGLAGLTGAGGLLGAKEYVDRKSLLDG